MYRGIVEHHSLISAYLREEIKSHQLEGPYEYGRIYRVVPVDKPAPRVAQIARITNAQWVEHLATRTRGGARPPSSCWSSSTTPRRCRRSAGSRRPARARSGRVQAMWTLEGIGALDRATVMAG